MYSNGRDEDEGIALGRECVCTCVCAEEALSGKVGEALSVKVKSGWWRALGSG